MDRNRRVKLYVQCHMVCDSCEQRERPQAITVLQLAIWKGEQAADHQICTTATVKGNVIVKRPGWSPYQAIYGQVIIKRPVNHPQNNRTLRRLSYDPAERHFFRHALRWLASPYCSILMSWHHNQARYSDYIANANSTHDTFLTRPNHE